MEYKENGRETFDFETFENHFSDVKQALLNKALYNLQSDGLISIFPADNVAYHSTLLPQAIIEVEENTMLKKGYTIFKEIRSLLI